MGHSPPTLIALASMPVFAKDPRVYSRIDSSALCTKSLNAGCTTGVLPPGI